jgi:hypothetical protein
MDKISANYLPPSNVPGIIKFVIPNYPNLRENMGSVIGLNGRHFKMLSHYADVRYIWYDKKTNLIEIWDDNTLNINLAVHLIHRHLSYFSPPPK